MKKPPDEVYAYENIVLKIHMNTGEGKAVGKRPGISSRHPTRMFHMPNPLVWKLRPPIWLAIGHPPQEIFIDSMSSPMFNLLKSLMRLFGFNTSSVPLKSFSG